MRRVLTCLAFLIAFPLAISAQETATVNCLGQKKLDLIALPEGTEVVAELQCGDRIAVLKRTGNWARVKTDNGKEGYLATVFLTVGESTVTPGQQTTAPTSSAEGVESPLPVIRIAYASCGRLPNVDVFGGKDRLSMIATIACGEKVDVLASEGTWVRVRKENKVEGYVTSYFLESEAEHAVFSHVKSSQKYPLTLEVAGASSQVYARGRLPDTPATPDVTRCTGTGGESVDVTCKTTPGTPAQPGKEIQNVRVSLQTTLNGIPMAIGCNAGWVASHCGELSLGSYQARWKNDSHKQVRVLVLQAGKSREITLDVH